MGGSPPALVRAVAAPRYHSLLLMQDERDNIAQQSQALETHVPHGYITVLEMLLGLFEGRTASALRLQGAAFCHASPRSEAK